MEPKRPIKVTSLDSLALSWFITEAMFFVTSRKADCCEEQIKVRQSKTILKVYTPLVFKKKNFIVCCFSSHIFVSLLCVSEGRSALSFSIYLLFVCPKLLSDDSWPPESLFPQCCKCYLSAERVGLRQFWSPNRRTSQKASFFYYHGCSATQSLLSLSDCGSEVLFLTTCLSHFGTPSAYPLPSSVSSSSSSSPLPPLLLPLHIPLLHPHPRASWSVRS